MYSFQSLLFLFVAIQSVYLKKELSLFCLQETESICNFILLKCAVANFQDFFLKIFLFFSFLKAPALRAMWLYNNLCFHLQCKACWWESKKHESRRILKKQKTKLGMFGGFVFCFFKAKLMIFGDLNHDCWICWIGSTKLDSSTCSI